MKISVVLGLLGLSPLFMNSVSVASAAQPVRMAKLHGSIEKATVDTSTWQPKEEKVCDFTIEVPVFKDSDGGMQSLVSSTPCATQLEGETAKVVVTASMSLTSVSSGESAKKTAQLILTIESSKLSQVNNFVSAGTSSKDLSLDVMNLSLGTPIFESKEQSRGIQESFSVSASFEDKQ